MDDTRRKFLKASGCALTMVGLASQSRHFGLMSAMAKDLDSDGGSGIPSDYRALVCILLSGGNDGNNLIIPNHSDQNLSSYQVYASSRSKLGLSIPQNRLLPVTVPLLGDLSYGFHPSLGQVPELGGINNGIYELWGQGKLAAVVNSGNLIRPLTKVQFQQTPSLRPYQLFSHSDQAQQQQSAFSNSPSPVGWGGKIADRTNAASNPGSRIPMITSIGGTHLFTLGLNTTPLAIRDAAVPLDQTLLLHAACCGDPITQARMNALAGIRTIDLDSEPVRATSYIMDRAQEASAAFSSFQEVTAPFPSSSLGNQLKQVARIVKKRTELNVNRQVFFVELGGFDSHQNQLLGSNSQASLLAQLSQAMRAFYDEMGVQGVQDKVTMFTLSDFGRTMSPSGVGAAVGTEHGWGSHMLVLGGAVSGGNFYGSRRPDGSGSIFPTLVPGGPDDIDTASIPRGRWLPTTSVDQYAATLGRWFGLTESDLQVIFPNLGSFPNSNLGFMTA